MAASVFLGAVLTVPNTYTLAGTTNQVVVTESPAGTFTFTAPQAIAAASTPTFAGLTLSTLATSDPASAGVLYNSSGTVKVSAG